MIEEESTFIICQVWQTGRATRQYGRRCHVKLPGWSESTLLVHETLHQLTHMFQLPAAALIDTLDSKTPVTEASNTVNLLVVTTDK